MDTLLFLHQEAKPSYPIPSDLNLAFIHVLTQPSFTTISVRSQITKQKHFLAMSQLQCFDGFQELLVVTRKVYPYELRGRDSFRLHAMIPLAVIKPLA